MFNIYLMISILIFIISVYYSHDDDLMITWKNFIEIIVFSFFLWVVALMMGVVMFTATVIDIFLKR